MFRTRLSGDGFRDLRGFLSAVTSGRFHEHLKPMQMAGASEGVGSQGGFYVPSLMLGEMLDGALELEVVRPRASVRPFRGAESITVPAFDRSDHSGGAIGGFGIQWLAEKGTATDQTPSTRKIEMHAHKAGIWTRASSELLADAGLFDAELRQALFQAIAWGLDDAFLNGGGAGQPLGVLNDPALVTVGAESGQTADTLLYQNLLGMFARLHPASLANAVWIANPTTIPQLGQLFASDGTTSTHVPVMRDDGSGAFTILTRPVVFTEKLPVLGDVGDIVLADLSQYLIALREDAAIQTSIHIGWQTDEMAFRVILRADGQGKWASAITPKNGLTQSWAVALAAR